MTREKEQPERRIHSGARSDEKKPLGFASCARFGGRD